MTPPLSEVFQKTSILENPNVPKMQVWMYPQKSSKNSKKRRRGEGRRLFETFPKNSTFFMSFPRDYLFLSLFLTQMFSIWYQHICMWFCLRDPDFRGVFFWTFQSICQIFQSIFLSSAGVFFLNFPEYFSKFLVFFWICQPKLSEDLLFLSSLVSKHLKGCSGPALVTFFRFSHF